MHGEKRTFVCFGFGAIGAGLMVYEAARSGAFRRLAVAEVVPETVAALRAAGGRYTVNVARSDRVDAETVGPVEALNPAEATDRAALVAAVAGSDEMATAVPSVDFYARGGKSGLAAVLAEGLALRAARSGARTVLYAAENHNHAAEQLEELVLERVPPELRGKVRDGTAFLNTVIGKMSGLADDPAGRGLTPVTPASARAFLVEEFNRILVSQPCFPEPFARGISAFAEKPDLLPFEEAKLYGHNAAHALAAYLGRLLGVPDMSTLHTVPGLLEFVRSAFLEESGGALIHRHQGLDPLFTPPGYAAYADDLLARMTNPFLGDTIERVTRDPARKLGWDDRLIGTMRTALHEGVEPRRFAVGAAAAISALDAGFIDSSEPAGRWLAPLWGASAPEETSECEAVLALIESGRRFLRRTNSAGWAEPGAGPPAAPDPSGLRR